MLSLLRRLKSNYQPLNRITISQPQLLSNFNQLKKLQKNIAITPVLKSNAYGHGLVQIGKIIDSQKPPFICVDSLPEANILRKNGTKSEILIMGSIAKESLKRKLPYQLTIINNDSLKNFKALQKDAKVHLFIDTGMNREGIPLEELPETLKLLKDSDLKLIGIMSHLAIAYDQNHLLTKKQLKNFKQAKQLVLEAGFSPTWFHLGGSDCLTWIDSNLVNLVRCGRLLYGIAAPNQILKPILQLESTIVQIKQLKKGESVGYDATFKAQNNMKIALLPIGYNDGVDRRLSNKGFVLIRENECKILGLISMNMIVVDVSKVQSLKVGERAIIFSANNSDQNSIENSSKLAKTNPSDLLVGLHTSTRREVI